MDATIYHNPRCTKSRQALARLEEAGINVTVVKYLDDVPTTTQLKKLITDAGLTVREAVRTGETEYKELARILRGNWCGFGVMPSCVVG
ncbi:arsenate reductase [Mycobacteroides abscessus subsp. abscessus]|nr:arsenate reductase [Mycobacteroides abscessus subsp. abscessus]